MSTMSEWIEAVCAELDLNLADQRATTTVVLDLTADVATGWPARLPRSPRSWSAWPLAEPPSEGPSRTRRWPRCPPG